MDYFDILLAKNLANKGDITTESLSVTQNGTYTAPSGKAYTPVTVEVAPPANSYQLKSITTPTPLATFEASEMPMPSLKVSVKAKQASGTPSPSNPLPISGWDAVVVTDTGINIWDEEWELGTYSGTTGEKVSGASNIRCKNAIAVSSNTTYYFKSPNVMYVFEYNVSGDFIKYSTIMNNTFTTAVNTKAITFHLIAGYGTTYNNDISINYPSTDTSYHAYNGVTTTISLGQTVYGGELDVVNGTSGNKLTHGYVDLGSLNWTYYSTQDVFAVNFTDAKPSGTSYGLNALCSSYEVKTDTRYQNLPDKCIMVGSNFYSFTTASIIVRDSAYTDAASFKTAMNGVQLVYELATPTTFTTQPTPIKSLNGINNLSVDCGEIIEGEYFKALGGDDNA